jgi:hypothetical protein
VSGEEKDLLLVALESTINRVNEYLRRDRERAYRRALARIGAMPQTIDLLVEEDRDWIDTGIEGDG